MARKKVAKPIKAKNSNDDSFDEETAKQIYSQTNTNYEAPENHGLGTILEANESEADSSRNPRNRNGKAILPPQLRMMTRTGQHYLYEDKEKFNLRKKQSSKLFKGRKKIKWKGLTPQQEVNLMELIANKSETESSSSSSDEEDEDMRTDQNHPNNQMPFIMDCNESSTLSLQSSTSKEALNSESVSSENSFHTPMKSVDNSNVFHDAAADVVKTDEKSLKKHPVSPTPASTPSAAKIPYGLTPDTTKHKKNEATISHDLKEIDDFLGPLGFSDNEDDISDELLSKSKTVPEPLLPPPGPPPASTSKSDASYFLTNSTIKKQTEAISHELKEIDAVFGPLGFSDDEEDDSEFSFKSKKIAQTNSNKENTGGVRRQSTIAKVRRSSRFLTPLTNNQTNSNSNECLGSIITEVEIKDRRKSRRSNLFIRPKLELIEKSRSSSPILNEETMKLIKNDQSSILDLEEDDVEDYVCQQKRLKSFE